MNTDDNYESEGITLVQAVETLSNIADLDFERDIEVTKTRDITIQGSPLSYKAIHWLQEKEPEEAVGVIRQTFRVVHSYLRDFYETEYRNVGSEEAMDEIKTIMVLVGEAAKKLDKYTRLFHQKRFHSVLDLKEYKDLQKFYLTRIARKIDEGTLGKWISQLTQQTMRMQSSSKTLKGKIQSDTEHVYVDLDSVKKDTEYELFFLRKENGTRFYSPRLIRNVKLVCDFGEFFEDVRGDDPLISVQFWLDRAFHNAAKEILSTVGTDIDSFYRKSWKRRYKKKLTDTLNKAIWSLMLASNPENLMRNVPAKTCLEYFSDFQHFLREALHTRDYEKIIVYPPKRSNSYAHQLIAIVEGLTKALYSGLNGHESVRKTVIGLIEEAVQGQSVEHTVEAITSHQLWSRLASDNVALKKLLKRHPSGPLNKVLKSLDQGNINSFDPLMQENLPNQLYSFYFGKHRANNLFLPSPTHQEFIHKAYVNEEFKAFLRSYAKGRNKKRHLYINFQDRTSWREHFRSNVIEEMPHQEFAKSLFVVTLPKDTEFYNQTAPYNQENHADVFIQSFLDQMSDENAGFYFPEKIRAVLFPKFVEPLLATVHELFFHKKNVLRRDERLNFIEIIYLFLQIKLIEITQPHTFNMSGKDGLDIGSCENALLFAFMHVIDKEEIDWRIIDQINAQLYAPVLLVRERSLLNERFNRMIGALKVIEQAKVELGWRSFARHLKKATQALFRMNLPWKMSD